MPAKNWSLNWKDHARPLTDTEDAILLHHQVTLQNDYEKSAAALNKAADSGSIEDQTSNRLRVAALSDQLPDVYNAGKSAGTESGRGLNARKMLAKEDYSLAKLETRLRAAKGGAPLTDAENTQIQELSKKINELTETHQKYVNDSEDRLASSEADNAILRIIKKVNGEKPGRAEPNVISKFISDRADEARARMKARVAGGRVNDVSSLACRR